MTIWRNSLIDARAGGLSAEYPCVVEIGDNLMTVAVVRGPQVLIYSGHLGEVGQYTLLEHEGEAIVTLRYLEQQSIFRGVWRRRAQVEDWRIYLES